MYHVNRATEEEVSAKIKENSKNVKNTMSV